MANDEPRSTEIHCVFDAALDQRVLVRPSTALGAFSVAVSFDDDVAGLLRDSSVSL